MKLYYSPGTCALSPHIVLIETKTPFDLVKTDIRAKKVEDGSDFFKVNPNGYVPALQLDDGTIITEGPAIVQYIADKAGSKLVPPNGTLERTKLQSWLNFVSSEIHKGFSPLFNPKLSDDAKAVHRERLLDRLRFLDGHFAGTQHLTGPEFSVADAYLFTTLTWAKPLGIDLSPLTRLEAYRARVLARAAGDEGGRTHQVRQ
jgi:glutathione S-transferase